MRPRILFIMPLLLATLQAFGQTYTYDEMNRLKKVTYPNGTEVAYTYDALGNRLTKQVSATGIDDPDPEPGTELEDGVYYLRNVATGKFWGADNDWGTRGSLVDEYQYVTLSRLSDGKYTMETMVTNGSSQYYFNGDYMDSDPVSLTITPVGKYYTFAIDNKYIGYDGSTTVLAKDLYADDENALWEAISEQKMKEEQDAIMAAATVQSPADATFLIKDPGFGRNRRDTYSAWTMDASNQNLGGGADSSHPNACGESWHSTFTLSQTITDAPKGVYKLSVQGFYRQDDTDYEHLPYFYINDVTSTFPEQTGTENSMTTAGVSFAEGLYEAEPMYIELPENGTLTVGAKLEENEQLWCIWDNFRLTYYGPEAKISDVEPNATIGKGDVNNDHRIDIADLTAMINIIQDMPTDGLNLENADLNDDGITNVIDISLLINIILGKQQ